jgi:gamma-glutamyl-gamma-aminobutyrate hydrolase PuuD
VAVQWHPEAGADPRLIKALVAAASGEQGRNFPLNSRA